ncbi:3-dehydroquinate synthase [Chloroflexota bacterium]
MGKATGRNIILIGFSTTGKTRVGAEIARRLGWQVMDTDNRIVEMAGKPIESIFAEDGEARFREYEKAALAEACSHDRAVIACGGGIVVDPSNRELMSDSGIVILLEARPETIYQRLSSNAGDEVRPLLAGDNPMQNIKDLKEKRQMLYNEASDWTVRTDNLTIEEVCDEVIRGWHYGIRRKDDIYSANVDANGSSSVVVTTSGAYSIFVGYGILESLGTKLKDAALSGALSVISDDNVYNIYGKRVEQNLKDVGYDVGSYVVPAGEQSKSLDVAAKIYDWMVERRVERGSAVIALGGGVVGDLAGYVAATYLRGLPLVHVPTSLLAMVDASIGGKVAVDHAQGKNLIGSFYQPRLVLSDVETPATLPQRELTSGWAELIKHALILDADLFDFLDSRAQKLVALDKEATVEAVARSAAIKAGVVSVDEKEAGLRTILNYGHTIAHGLETASGYDTFLHGEAVSIGMMGAAMISQRLGLISNEVVEKQKAILEKYGLPVIYRDIDSSKVLEAIELDKKVKGKKVRWVLLEDIGSTVIRDDVPQDLASEVIGELTSS